MIYNLFSKFKVRHEGFSFCRLRQLDEGADTDLMYNFCWPYTVSPGSEVSSEACLTAAQYFNIANLHQMCTQHRFQMCA